MRVRVYQKNDGRFDGQVNGFDELGGLRGPGFKKAVKRAKLLVLAKLKMFPVYRVDVASGRMRLHA